MVWTKSGILKELARLHQSGKEMSYNRLAKSRQSLVSAAAYHFGSYRRAVQQAGIDYAAVLRRPRWTRKNIIAIIKSARRRGDNLNWSAVIKRRDELGKAAFASLQKRLFGQWVRALQAAGVDGDDVALYRRWDRNTIAFDLRQRFQDGEEMSSGALQSDDPGLHAAALRHFSSFDAALRAARLDPEKIRRRKIWDKSSVIRAIKSEARSGQSMSDTRIRRQHPALYGAAVRLFGSYTAARSAAGIKFKSRRARKV
ncbi:MAG: hypothetical protein ABSG31_07160 [Tepidisphaeraceae bacterium]|jgi:hypothetical protein